MCAYETCALNNQTLRYISTTCSSIISQMLRFLHNSSFIVSIVFFSDLYRNWLTGIRLLAEGENFISPYIFGERGFRCVLILLACYLAFMTGCPYRGLGAVIYLAFLFLVIVILLNLLIAQFTKSYEDEIGKARVSVILNRAKTLSRMWNPFWLKLLVSVLVPNI